jgi:hypothetical protein
VGDKENRSLSYSWSIGWMTLSISRIEDMKLSRRGCPLISFNWLHWSSNPCWADGDVFHDEVLLNIVYCSNVHDTSRIYSLGQRFCMIGACQLWKNLALAVVKHVCLGPNHVTRNTLSTLL